MNKKSTRTSIRTAGLVLLLSGVVVALSSRPVQASQVLGPTSIKVTKTASVDDEGVVSGTISIKNVGANPAWISSIVDYLEVHFPSGVTPPPLPPGSTPNWFKVADVLGLQAVPNPIPVGATVDILYSFNTCNAEDYTGANSMRNVVAVTLFNGSKGPKTVTPRSDSFVPPSQEDCPVCGNDILESGEECDDGNTDNGDCCSSTCRFETGACNEDNACTTNDQCSNGECVGGAPLNCEDNNVCTTDTCDPASGCVNTPNANSCDDGDACTTGDVCSGGSCQPGEALDCNDNIGCNADTCDPVSGCVHTPRTECLDNDGCCPSGCNTSSANLDNDCLPFCGNGLVESGEQCDPPGDPQSCDVFDSGSLICNSDCTQCVNDGPIE